MCAHESLIIKANLKDLLVNINSRLTVVTVASPKLTNASALTWPTWLLPARAC